MFTSVDAYIWADWAWFASKRKNGQKTEQKGQFLWGKHVTRDKGSGARSKNQESAFAMHLPSAGKPEMALLTCPVISRASKSSKFSTDDSACVLSGNSTAINRILKTSTDEGRNNTLLQWFVPI